MNENVIPKTSSFIDSLEGPFLSKDELCQYFPYEDYSQKYKRKMLIAEGAFGSVSMGEDLTSQYDDANEL